MINTGVGEILVHQGLNSFNGIETIQIVAPISEPARPVIFTIDEIRQIVIDGQFTEADDTVVGTEVDDTLTSSTGGEDVLRGLAGADLYIVSDIINSSVIIQDSGTGGNDIVQFESLDFSDAQFARVLGDSDDLLVTDPALNRSILIKDTLDDNFSGGISFLRFDDGDFDIQSVRDILLAQETTGGDDTLIGFQTNDTLTSTGGNDVLNGRQGSDTYVVDLLTLGTVLIDDGATGSNDLVINNANVAAASFIRDRVDTDTLIIDFGGDRTITIRTSLDDNFSGGIDTVTFDDGSGAPPTVLTMQDIRDTLIAQDSSEGDDLITGFLVADTIEGGAGNDFLTGLNGGDLYVFNPGDGVDTIRDNGNNTTDVLDLGFGFGDLIAERGGADGQDAVLSFLGTTDQVTVLNGLLNNQPDRIEQYQLTDSTLDTQGLRQVIIAQEVTAGNDVLVGFNGDEILFGNEGDDHLIGLTGNDTYQIGIGHGADIVDDQAQCELDSRPAGVPRPRSGGCQLLAPHPGA